MINFQFSYGWQTDQIPTQRPHLHPEPVTRGGLWSTSQTWASLRWLCDPCPMIQPTSREHQLGSVIFKLVELKDMTICTDLPVRLPFISTQGRVPDPGLFTAWRVFRCAFLCLPMKNYSHQINYSYTHTKLALELALSIKIQISTDFAVQNSLNNQISIAYW